MDWSDKMRGWGMHGGEKMSDAQQGWADMQIPLIPAPMAFFGMIVAFMFGMMIGSMVSKKHATMQGDRRWRKRGTGSHHHHGYGAPMCCEPHSQWPSAECQEPEQR